MKSDEWSVISGQWVSWTIVFSLAVPSALAQTAGEARFFAGCPHRRYVMLHDEAHALDPHTLMYTLTGLLELEVFRLADWFIDLPWPGEPLHPFRRVIQGTRAGFHRLPAWYPIERAGELVDALQIPELSLGDASASYSVAQGSLTGSGSGMVVRAHELIDWTQHVLGDMNRLLGWTGRRPGGLLAWRTPERAVDGLQWMIIKGFTHVSVSIARTLDGGLTWLERAGERVVNLGYRRAHEDTTVFVRLPEEVYRANGLWILEHRPQLVIATREEFLGRTHAAMAHRQGSTSLRDWSATDTSSALILMADMRLVARAPGSLRAYVVPAAWVLERQEQ